MDENIKASTKKYYVEDFVIAQSSKVYNGAASAEDIQSTSEVH